MPKDFSRSFRVADQIQRELADLLQNEIKDPRISQVTLTAVEVSRDYAYAKVFYTTLDGQDENAVVEKGLKHAAGFLRTGLSKRIHLRQTPQLIFVYDKSVERGAHLSQLIDKAIAKEKKTDSQD